MMHQRFSSVFAIQLFIISSLHDVSSSFVMIGHKLGRITPSTTAPTPTTRLWFDGKDNNNIDHQMNTNTNTNTNTNRPRSITSPVLENIIPQLLEHRDLYGHPNIALGTSEGRQCQTLRRLHIQQKLSQDEIQWLEQIGFRFNSLEDVYFEADFDDLFQKLKDYERIHQNRYQVPKKYNEDPELGAWVTGIRRLGTDRVHPKHKEMLDSIGFTWISLRRCGSKFMKKYRDLVARAQQTNAGPEELLQDESVISWLTAQRQARKRGTLSDTRMDYMNQLFGEGWMDMDNTNNNN